MPIYEYRCGGCDREFERYVSSSATKVACPACGEARVTRKLSMFALGSDGGFLPSRAGTGASGGGCCGGGCSCH